MHQHKNPFWLQEGFYFLTGFKFTRINKKVISDNLHRFSDRVDNYVKYRPHYPEEIIAFLQSENVLKDNDRIADIGSGTGISCELFLNKGFTVFGIEPNAEMREAAEKILSSNRGFKSINGTAEHTTLENNSVELVVAGQAFHWFDREKSKKEFRRILKPRGNVVLMWNDRRTDRTDFLKVYEDFLHTCGTDYAKVNHKNVQDEKIFDEWFGKGNYKSKSFYNFQDFDFEGLKGRVLSSSYMPAEGHVNYDFMIYCLKKIFLRYQEKGKVRFEYDTRIYYGPLAELHHPAK
ncbi:MAG: class I SAM-dependent methyltransferase [Bacteroidia bacterium]